VGEFRLRVVPRISCGAALLLAVGACAHVQAPPGGPEDLTPPAVLTTRPAPQAVVPRYDGPVVFVFDERISERGVQEAVMVSPRTSPVDVRPGRDEIRVSLRRGWEPGLIYHVTLRPEIRDLFNNQIPEPFQLVFSTGPEIPETRVVGRVADRITGRLQRDARVEAIRLVDSLVYAVPTDTAGRFDLSRIPEGEYQIRAFPDLNRTRMLEPFEPRDSAFVAVTADEPVELTLRILLPDTTPPVLASATLRESLIHLEFDDHLDPEQAVDTAQVTVTGADGDRVPLVDVWVGAPAAAISTLPGTGPLPSRNLVVELPASFALEPDAEYEVVVERVLNLHGLPGGGRAALRTPPAPSVP
jgi:hypothetical protein